MCMHGSVCCIIQHVKSSKNEMIRCQKWTPAASLMYWWVSLCCAFSNMSLWSLRWYRWLKMNWQGYGRKWLWPDILLWVVPKFYNRHSLHHVSPDIWIKCPMLMVALTWQALLRKPEMWTFYSLPSTKCDEWPYLVSH